MDNLIKIKEMERLKKQKEDETLPERVSNRGMMLDVKGVLNYSSIRSAMIKHFGVDTKVDSYYFSEEQKQQEETTEQETTVVDFDRKSVLREDNIYSSQLEQSKSIKDSFDKVKVHRGTGAKYALQGNDVVAFDIGGSGFSQFRADHKGFKGKSDGAFYSNKAQNEHDVEIENTYIKDLQNVTEEDLQIEDLNQVRLTEKEKVKVRFYNKRNSIFHKLFKTRSEEDITRENAYRLELKKGKIKMARQFREHYGKNVTLDGKKKQHILKKEQTIGTGKETRYTLAGPGALNYTSEHSIGTITEYVTKLAEIHVRKKYDEFTINGKDKLSELKMPEIVFQLRGHSRGAVAVSASAMAIKKMVREKFPPFVTNWIRFETLQYDPVPGKDYQGAKTHDLASTENVSEKKYGLEASANSTVVYSLHTEKDKKKTGDKLIELFKSQTVLGADRIIITAKEHSVGLGNVDVTEGKTNKHIAGYFNTEDKQFYRNTGLNELPRGLYIADENNNLFRFTTAEDAKKVLEEIWGHIKSDKEQGRHEVMRRVTDAWFENEDINLKKKLCAFKDFDGNNIYTMEEGENASSYAEDKKNELAALKNIMDDTQGQLDELKDRYRQLSENTDKLTDSVAIEANRSQMELLRNQITSMTDRLAADLKTYKDAVKRYNDEMAETRKWTELSLEYKKTHGYDAYGFWIKQQNDLKRIYDTKDSAEMWIFECAQKGLLYRDAKTGELSKDTNFFTALEDMKAMKNKAVFVDKAKKKLEEYEQIPDIKQMDEEYVMKNYVFLKQFDELVTIISSVFTADPRLKSSFGEWDDIEAKANAVNVVLMKMNNMYLSGVNEVRQGLYQKKQAEMFDNEIKRLSS